MQVVRAVVDSRVRLVDQLPPDVQRAAKALFTHPNPDFHKRRGMGYSTHGTDSTISTWSVGERPGLLAIPRGGHAKLRDLLAEHGLDLRCADHRERGDLRAGALIPEHHVEPDDFSVELWPHQEASIAAIERRENCLIRAGTGSGKTSSVLALFSRLRVPSLAIVWSGGLLEQWTSRVTRELRIPPSEVGLIGAGKERIRPVTIAMQQTIASRGIKPEWARYFGCVAIDEVQRAPAKTCFRAIDGWPARYRVGVSADETRKDRMEFLTRDLFGVVAHEVSRDELIAQGIIVDVQVRIVPTDFRAPWWIRAPRDANAFGAAEQERDSDFNRLLAEMIASADREAIVDRCVASEVAAGSQVLVLSHRVEHCATMEARFAARGFKTGLLLGGEQNKREFARSVEGLKSGAVRVGVGTYQAVGTGTDLPGVEAAVCTTPNAGNRQFFGQVWGRVCRAPKGKTDARLYYLFDRHVMPDHRHNLVKWNNRVVEWDGRSWKAAS